MTSDPQQKPEHAHHDEEIEVIKTIWNDYGKPITGALVVAVVVMGAFNFIKINKQNKLNEASISLAEAKDADALSAVIANYPKSPAAPAALLTLGSMKLNEGAFQEATAAFEQFTTDYTSHPMLPVAEISLANSLEAQSNTDAALDEYKLLVEKYPEHYITAAATFGMARCLQQLDRPEEARIAFENLESKEVAAPYSNLIAFNLDFADMETRRVKAASIPIAAPATAPAPEAVVAE